MQREVTVINKNGLHARPSVALAQKVREFNAKVKLRKDDMLVDASDVLQILTLGATFGTRLTIEAEGEQAEEVITELEFLFKSNFNVVY